LSLVSAAGRSSLPTGSSGAYEITGIPNGSHTVTPQKTGYTFDPTSRTNVGVSNGDTENINFYTYIINGHVTKYEGGLVNPADVDISISGPWSGTLPINSSGFYERKGFGSGAYTITPSSSVYCFDPQSHNSIDINSANYSTRNAGCDRDFTAIIPPTANFTINPAPPNANGVAPLEVTITGNTSTGDIVSYSWDFGDGTTDPSRIPPPHTYNTHGIYPIILTVTGPSAIPLAERTDTKQVDMAVLAKPVSVTGADKTEVNEGDTVQLDGTSSHDPDNDTGATRGIQDYTWSVESGPAVINVDDPTQFSDPASPTPTFTPPLGIAGSGAITVTFKLDVTDINNGLHNDPVADLQDTVTITIIRASRGNKCMF
jgi:PKD repeat protein